MAHPVPEKITDEGWQVMFHATTSSRASSILAENRFRPGTGGFLGGNMYFSKAVHEAKKRQRRPPGDKTCVVLQASVFLGRCGHFRKGSGTVGITGEILHANKLNSAKVADADQDSYCLCATKNYKKNPTKRIKNIARYDVPAASPQKRGKQEDTTSETEVAQPPTKKRRMR
ncbi:unnamed protein product [Amoebophrya sp. A120]|nr:unnamed protein product [Amoebophrya sp. A120]|eukprot:GSA120T00025897001.1